MTRSQLQAMPDRDLDFLVDKIVMGNDQQMHIPACFTNEWDAFGALVQKMLHLGFKPDVRNMAADLVDFGWVRISPIEGQNRWNHTGPFWPRTAAIAAVLLCQEAA